MQYLRIKNYEQYQHYKDRNPPWIKLYRCIMNDYGLRTVPIASRLAYVYLLIIASETDNRIPNDHKFLSDRFGFEVNELTLTPLIDSGFLLASGARRLLACHATSSSLLSLDSLNHPDSDLKSKKQSQSNGRDYRDESKTILAFLNEKTGKKFREVDANLSMIEARLKSGVALQDCRTLIARKVRDWGTDPKMVSYLRPETLFNKTKFETYLAEVTK